MVGGDMIDDLIALRNYLSYLSRAGYTDKHMSELEGDFVFLSAEMTVERMMKRMGEEK
jgi:hypothetical protein